MSSDSVSTDEVTQRMSRHYLNWTSVRRWLLFFPGLLYIVISLTDGFPVVAFVQASSIERVENANTGTGELRLEIEGRKLRACLRRTGSHDGQVRSHESAWIDVKFSWTDERNREAIRPTGWTRQHFGEFVWTVDQKTVDDGLRIEDVSHVRAAVLHRCGDNVHISRLGSLVVDEPSKVTKR